MPITGAGYLNSGTIYLKGNQPNNGSSWTDGMFYCAYGGAPFHSSNLPNQTTNFSLKDINHAIRFLGQKPNYTTGSPYSFSECRGAYAVGGGPGGLCIHDEILVNVSMDGTLKNISELEIGDLVLAYNQTTKEEQLVPILQIEKPEHDNMYILEMETEGKPVNFSMTEDHPVYKTDETLASIKPDVTLSNYGLEATELKVGDELLVSGDTKNKIKRIERFAGTYGTYTILTEHNNFYAEGILVHSEIGE